jgi:hypothetical protein
MTRTRKTSRIAGAKVRPQYCSFSFADADVAAKGWYPHNPRKRARRLVFEYGMLAFQHHYLWLPSKTSIQARFRGWSLFTSTTTLHPPRKRAHMLVFEDGVLLSITTTSPPSNTSAHARSRGWSLFASTTTLHPPKTSAHARFRGQCVAFHHHHLNTLEYERSCSFSRALLSITTTFHREQACACSRGWLLFASTVSHHPRNRALMLVIEGGVLIIIF